MSDKPVVTKGAELVLFFGLFIPAASLPLLVGALLLLDEETTNQVFGGVLIVASLVGMGFALVSFFRHWATP